MKESDMTPPCQEACCRHKHREAPEYDALIKRLNRIEGQVRGVRGNAFSRELLGNHIRTCVVQDIQSGHTEVIDDLLSTIQKLMK